MKKPIELCPRDIWYRDRYVQVCSAISRYYNDGLVIPLEWIEEYNELVKILNPISNGVKNE